VAACDVDVERARRYASHFGAKLACASLDEVIAKASANAVILSVGPRQHPDLACHALAAGLHVWMEKPPAMDVAGIDRMIAARDKAGRNVVVGFRRSSCSRGPHADVPGRSAVWTHLHDLRPLPMDVPTGRAKVLAEGKFTNWLGNGVHR